MGIFKAFHLKNAPKYFTEAVSITWQEPVSLTPDYSQSSFLETIMEPSKCRLCFMISCLKCHAVIKPLRVSTKYQPFHQIISYDNAYVHCPVSTNFLTLKKTWIDLVVTFMVNNYPYLQLQVKLLSSGWADGNWIVSKCSWWNNQQNQKFRPAWVYCPCVAFLKHGTVLTLCCVSNN